MIIRPEDNPGEYDKHILNHGNWSVYQTWQWGEVIKSLGFKLYRYLIEDADGSPFGLSLQAIDMAWGIKILLAHGVPIWEKPSARRLKDLAGALRDLGRQHGAVFVALEPYLFADTINFAISEDSFLDSGFQRSAIYQRPRHTLMIDLQPSEEEIFALMNKRHQTNIRRAERLGVEATTGRREHIRDFCHLYEILMESKGKGWSYNLGYWQRIYDELCPPGYADFLIGLLDGNIESGAFYLRHANVYQLFIIASDKSSKSEASYKVMWEAIKKAKSSGYRLFEVSYIDTEAGPKSGLALWKYGFGGKVVQYCGPYELIVSSSKYNFLHLLYRVAAKLNSRIIPTIRTRFRKKYSKSKSIKDHDDSGSSAK